MLAKFTVKKKKKKDWAIQNEGRGEREEGRGGGRKNPDTCSEQLDLQSF